MVDKKEEIKKRIRRRFEEEIEKYYLGRPHQSVSQIYEEFKEYFSDVKTDYINSFLPASTIEPGRSTVSHTRFLFRLRNGVYLVHADAIQVCGEGCCESD